MANIFYIVLKTSLYAAIVGLVIMLFKGMLKDKLNAQWHYLIWFVLILKLLIPFGPESAMSLFNAMPQIPQQSMVDIVYEFEQAYENTSSSENHLPHEPPAPQQIKAAKATTFNEDLLPYIWIFGVALMLIWVIITYCLFQKKLRQSSFAPDERILSILESCKSKMGINQNISLVMQNAVSSPSLMGIINPQILFPAESNLSDKEVEYILLHELSHYRRKDILVNYLLLGFQIVHWFNPVMWYCFKRIRQDMEIATDERVLSLLDHTEHKDYGRALLAMLEDFSTSKLAPRLLGMMDDKKDIERRLKMIKMADFFKSRRRLVLVLGLTCMVILSSVLLTNGLPKQNSPKTPGMYDTEALFKYKTPYVGNNSKVINLISNLPYAQLRKEVSLQTKATPYGITVNYDFSNTDMDTQRIENTLRHNTIILFTLIDNVDAITYNIGNINEQFQYQYSRSELQQNFSSDLREYAKDIHTFENFVDRLVFKLLVYPSKYALTLSSTPGIRIQAKYPGSVAKVRYTADKGKLFTWTGNISKWVKMKELPYDTPIYWSPLDQNDIAWEDHVVTVTLLDEKGKTIDEKALHIDYDGSMFYSVKPAMDIVIGTKQEDGLK